jgi:hypothetical protein
MHGCYPSYAGRSGAEQQRAGFCRMVRLGCGSKPTKQRRIDAETLELEGEESVRYRPSRPRQAARALLARFRGMAGKAFLKRPLISWHARQMPCFAAGAAPMTGTPTANQPSVRFCSWFDCPLLSPATRPIGIWVRVETCASTGWAANRAAVSGTWPNISPSEESKSPGIVARAFLLGRFRTRYSAHAYRLLRSSLPRAALLWLRERKVHKLIAHERLRNATCGPIGCMYAASAGAVSKAAKFIN